MAIIYHTAAGTTADALTLEAKLALESRACGTCGYQIANPMTDRCPRCYSSVPLSDHTNCGDCTHQGSCEFEKLRPGVRGR